VIKIVVEDRGALAAQQPLSVEFQLTGGHGLGIAADVAHVLFGGGSGAGAQRARTPHGPPRRPAAPPPRPPRQAVPPQVSQHPQRYVPPRPTWRDRVGNATCGAAVWHQCNPRGRATRPWYPHPPASPPNLVNLGRSSLGRQSGTAVNPPGRRSSSL